MGYRKNEINENFYNLNHKMDDFVENLKIKIKDFIERCKVFFRAVKRSFVKVLRDIGVVKSNAFDNAFDRIEGALDNLGRKTKNNLNIFSRNLNKASEEIVQRTDMARDNIHKATNRFGDRVRKFFGVKNKVEKFSTNRNNTGNYWKQKIGNRQRSTVYMNLM